MSHFAELDKSGAVLRVIVAEQAFIDTMPGLWVQTSYSAKIRGKFAGIGDIYDAKADVFVAPEVTVIDAPTGNMPK